MANFLGSLFSKNESSRFIQEASPLVAQAGALSDELEKLSQGELQKRLQDVRERTGGSVEQVKDIAEVFALVRETSRRVLGERHYDVQLIGGLALAKGKIAEMRTGEGKTLVATLAATLKSLSGNGVHVVTVNDYLARRDGAWMGQIYEYLGLTLGVVTHEGAYRYDGTHTQSGEDAERDEAGSFKVFYDYLRPVTKKEAYAADITYVTNNELGFDYLRDNTEFDSSRKSHRGYHFAIIDEIDSILIDEARTPLIISGPAPKRDSQYEQFAEIAKTFVIGEDFTVDEKQRAIQLTSEGIAKAERALGIDNLYTEGSVQLAHHLETAVRAQALFKRDKEYVVQNNQIVIVDEFTGRLQPGRRWSDGIHQAVEAKEGLSIQAESRTYATVTFQNLFRMYDQLSGMTGTALTSEEEFYTVYKLEVVSIPTHKPVQRNDHDDFIFQTVNGKYTALTREVKELHEKGQPVLIGTVAIEDNEVVSNYLREAGIPHEVLNAKNHEREGEIIAQAGRKGRVTVATNLAGRGVDIKLGGAPLQKETYDEVVALGGLAVIGTERHEARRIDNQLRGRSGRQGDPGDTRFYVSLEDRLMRVFAAETLKKVMGGFNLEEDKPIASGMITKALETAQKRIEGHNFDTRKQVLAYDDVMNTQRIAVYQLRNQILEQDNEAFEALLKQTLTPDAFATYEKRREEFGAEIFSSVCRRLYLQIIDAFWLEHLETMEYVRKSVSLRSYGQRDPLIEYQKEGLRYFKTMKDSINETLSDALPRIQPADETAIKKTEEKTRSVVQAAAEASAEKLAHTPVRNTAQYDRNDIVTIEKDGEQMTLKYKKAEVLLSEGWTIVDEKKN